MCTTSPKSEYGSHGPGKGLFALPPDGISRDKHTANGIEQRCGGGEARFHRPSTCSGVKALRYTSDAKTASRQAPLAFRSLDPFRALREPDRRRRRTAFPAPNKEL